MKKHTLTFLLLWSIQLSFGQGLLKFGDIAPSAFSEDYSALDTSASVIVTYDYGETEFAYSPSRGFEIETIYHVRKHILKKNGLDEGIVTIPYYRGINNRGELVSRVKAITHNLQNGKVSSTELGRKEIFDEKIDDDYNVKKFSMADVTEGSIIEYTYTRTTPLNTLNNPRTWAFQSDVPVLWSEYNITIPSYFYYQIIFGGYLPLQINERQTVNFSIPGTSLGTNALKYRFAVANAPAFKDEPFISTESDYLSKVEFELSSIELPGQAVKNYNTTWAELDQTMTALEKWSECYKTPGFLTSLGKEFSQIADGNERIKAIHSYMVQNFKWDDYVGLYPHETMKKVFDNKTGSATELNLLAVSLLRSSGIPANPVILSTRSNGKINPSFPLLDRFNYTMAVVNLEGKKILFDVTEPLLPLGLIPQRCFGGQGREISENGGVFIDLVQTSGFSEFEEIDVKIIPEEALLQGHYKSVGTGYHGQGIRKSYKDAGDKDFKEGIKKAHSEWDISNIEIENMENPEASVSLAYDFSKEEGGIMSDMIYITPLLSGTIKENIFKSKTRLYPIDFGHTTNISVKSTYEIPEGFEVEELPQSVNISLPEKSGKFIFFCQEKDNKITVLSRINLYKPVFTAEEFGFLKEFYDLIVQKHAEQIVLKHIEE